MLHVNFASIVDFCLRRAWVIVLASAVILVGSSAYVARHFAINSNISNLLSLDDMTRPLNTIADTVENVLAKRPATFSWQVLVNGAPAKPEDLSRLVDIVPVLDYDALEPGKTATEAVRKAVADARLDSDYDASVRLNATGEAIEIYEWGRAVTSAFIKAGALAIVSIAILFWLVLRRIGDVLLTLIPLLVAAAATLEICAMSGFALNYANIIALPALLGVGVAFKIYYVVAWRSGEYNFLQSSLTRAVFFSALMTATAFGSLWFSAHPGISSMGKLLALSLACTLASAALFQPALMGPPRKQGEDVLPP
jgi:hypothetical protein